MPLPSIERDLWFLDQIKNGAIFVSSCGSKITYKNKEVCQRLSNNGYLFAHICGHVIASHRVVYLYFYGEIGVATVNHIDGIKTNNSKANLELATHKEQMQHFLTLPKADAWRLKQKEAKSGVGNGMAKLAEMDIQFIRSYKEGYGTSSELAKHFGVCRRTIVNIRKGISYQNI